MFPIYVPIESRRESTRLSDPGRAMETKILPVVARAIRFTFLAMLGVLAFQLVKHRIFPNITIWESHLVTILFFTLAAFVVSLLIFRREAQSRADLLQELERRRSIEEQLRVQTTALNAAANAVLITDHQGVVVWANPAFNTLTGYGAEEILGQVPHFLKSGKHDSQFYRDLWQTILSGAVWQGEITNRRKDGSLYVEEMTITPVRSETGEISHFIAIKVDVTERKRAQEALSESEATLRSLVQNALYGIFRSTPAGTVLSANRAMCEMLGYSEAELLSLNLRTVYCNPEDRPPILESMLKTGTVRDVESTWKRKDGSSVSVLLNGHTCSDGQGGIIFEGFVRDVTARRRAELELRRLNRALSTLGKCNEALVHATDEVQLLDEVCEILVQVGGYRLAWVGYAEYDPEKTVRWIAKSGFDEGYIQKTQITWADSEHGHGPVGTAIRSGKVCIVRDVLQHADFSPWRDEAVQRGYASVISLPLILEIMGALTIYAPESDAFDEHEVELLKELAHDLAYGIASLRNEAERRRVENALRDSEERYRMLFARSPHPMWILDVHTRAFLEVNNAAIAHYGYSREQFLSMTVDDMVPSEELPRLQSHFSTARSGYSFYGESRHCKKDGTLIDVEIAAHRFFQDGKLVSLALANDVTERLRAEESLRASEQRYRTLFEHNFCAVFRSHGGPTGGKVLDCNEAMCRMLGYRREEMLALDSRTLHRDLAVREAGWKVLLEDGELINFEVELQRKDGGSITVLANLKLLHEAPGEPLVLEGILLDITEVRKLQEQLLQSQKLEALGKLTGGIAHDFNNILMIINACSELALDKIDAQDSLRRPVEQIRDAGARGASLTRQLLAFSRKQVMTPAVLNLSSLLSDAEEMLKRLIGEDVSLEVFATENLWMTKADRSQIEQVVFNLAVNARDAMPKGGKLILQTANVQLGDEFVRTHPGSRAGQYVALMVTDTGSGISRELQSRIFEPFFTTKAPGKGTGLGLSTVYGIVKQSNGYITLESEPGQGARFCIYLPRTLEAAARIKEEQAEVAAPQGSTVLLVEDEDPTREAITDYLQAHGFRVIAASSAQEALRRCEATPAAQIDVLLTDMVMPGMSGTDLAARFRAQHPDARVVFMSGYTDEVLDRSGMHSQQVALLTKPFRLPDLVSKLREMLTDPAEASRREMGTSTAMDRRPN